MQLAVIKTGGKQYLVTEGMTLDVESLTGESGAKVVFDEVLLSVDGEKVQLGTPTVAGAKVEGEIVEQLRDPKVTVMKMKRRKRYRRKLGHRQHKTRVKVTKIS